MKQTVSLQLRMNFEKEVILYTKQLADFLGDKTKQIFGSTVTTSMPKGNIADISAKYIQLGKTELIRQGVRTRRAESLSKNSFEAQLEELMKYLERI